MNAPVDDLDLTQPRAIHILGVGGAGMRSIASVLAALGHDVSGSDLKPSAGLDRLEAEGVRVHVGHRAENLGGAQLVARSTAVGDRNVEVRTATERGIPVLSRADVLAALTRIRPTEALQLVVTPVALAPIGTMIRSARTSGRGLRNTCRRHSAKRFTRTSLYSQ